MLSRVRALAAPRPHLRHHTALMLWRLAGLVCLIGMSLSLCAGCLSPAVSTELTASDAPTVITTEPRTLRVGQSANATPIVMDVFGTGDDTVLVLGGVHGDEPTGAAVARQVAAYLKQHHAQLVGRTVAIIAEVNPDGLQAGTRANARGVDLNRNYPSSDWRRGKRGRLSHGTGPASEPETRAVVRAIELIQPKRIIDIHSIKRGHHCNNYDGPGAALAAVLAECNGYAVEPSIGYATPGCVGSWTGIDLRIPTITLELPRDLDAMACWQENGTALLAFVQAGPPTTLAAK